MKKMQLTPVREQRVKNLTTEKWYDVIDFVNDDMPRCINDLGRIEKFYSCKVHLRDKETNERKFSMESLKQYFNSHKDTFYTLGIVILIDEFLFGGALRDKIKGLIERILNHSEKKLIGGSDEK